MTISARAAAPLVLAATTAAAAGIGLASAAPAGARPYHHSTISAPTTRQTATSTVTSYGRNTVVHVGQVTYAANTNTPANRTFDRVTESFFHPGTTGTASQTAVGSTAAGSTAAGSTAASGTAASSTALTATSTTKSTTTSATSSTTTSAKTRH